MKTKNIFRMLLVAAALLMGANNVKAEETKLWPAEGDNANANVDNLYISGETFNSLRDGDVLRINLNGNTNNQIQIFKSDWSGYFYFSQSFGNTIDLDVDATLRANLSNGIYIQGQGFTLKNIIRIINPPLATGENVIWGESSQWLNNWSDVFSCSALKFKKASANDKVRLYINIPNNQWQISFKLDTTGWPALNVWGNSKADVAKDGVVDVIDTNDGKKYIEFPLTDVLTSITAVDNFILQGQSIELKKVAIYVEQSGSTELEEPGLAYTEEEQTATVGIDFTEPTLTNPNDLTVRYSSSVSSVASVDESTGEVTPLKFGTTIITATFIGNSTYDRGSAQYTLTVNRGTATLSFQKESESVIVGNTVSSPTLTTTPSELSVTYSSSNSDVASVDQNSGVVTGVAAGTATITATFAQNDSYNQATASYTITVTEAPLATTYSITIDNTIENGRVVANKTSGIVAGETISLTATPNEGYEFDEWIVTKDTDGGSVTVTNNEFEMPADNVTVSASFKAVQQQQEEEKQTMVLRFEKTTDTATVGDDYYIPTLYANNQAVDDPSELGITFESSNPSIAKINRRTGEVELKESGTVTITAFFPGNDTYNEAEASFTLTVSAATQPEPEDYDYINVTGFSHGYRTYVTEDKIDFSHSDNVKGYYASGVSDSKVVFTQVTGVCAADVPLLLVKEGTGDCKLLVSESRGTTPENNLLKAGEQDDTDDSQGKLYGGNGTRGIYVLVYRENIEDVIFVETNINGARVDADHAYLDLSSVSNASSRLRISFKHGDDDSTGISNIEAESISNGVIYNLRGQRVENPTKGLYIINGKKVVIK